MIAQTGSGETVRDLYLMAYAAFDRGDFAQSAGLADRCLQISAKGSYWHLGTLGLQCWLHNFSGQTASVTVTVHTLLAADCGEDEHWFRGIAYFNLGLGKRQDKQFAEARQMFSKASAHYQQQQLHPGQPSEWQLVLRFFQVVANCASDPNMVHLAEFEDELQDYPDQSEEISHLVKAIRLLRRFANGENVEADAEKAIESGASRTYFALILLG